MKKTTLLLSLLFVIAPFVCFSQVTFEKEFDGQLNFGQIGGGHKLIVSNKDTDNNTRTIDIYNLDNSLYRSINLTNITHDYDEIIHVSDHLVNSDDKVEIMFNRLDFINNNFGFYILNEDGDLIFSVDDFFAPNGSQDINNPGNYFLEQTRDGVKLILNNLNLTKSRYYSLGTDGSLTSKINSENNRVFKPYPVPAKEVVNIGYNTPVNEFTNINVYDTSGSLLESFKMDDRFEVLKLNISDYDSGVYLYEINNTYGVNRGKFVVE